MANGPGNPDAQLEGASGDTRVGCMLERMNGEATGRAGYSNVALHLLAVFRYVGMNGSQESVRFAGGNADK